MKKALALIAGDKKLEEFQSHLIDCGKRLDQEIGFLKKQADNMRERHGREAREAWIEIEAYLRGKGLIPKEYEPKKKGHHIGFDHEAGVIYCCMDEHKDEPRVTVNSGRELVAFIDRLFE